MASFNIYCIPGSLKCFLLKLGVEYILRIKISILYLDFRTFSSVKCPLKREGCPGVTWSPDTYPGLRQDCLSLSFLGGNHRSLVWLTTRTELSSTIGKRKTQLKTNGLVSFYRERHLIVSPVEWEQIFSCETCKAVTMPHKHTFAHTYAGTEAQASLTSTHAHTKVCVTKPFKASVTGSTPLHWLTFTI